MDDWVSGALWWVWSQPHPFRIVLYVFASSWAALLVHELGHAVAARALGVRLWSVTLGYGPPLWNRELFGCRVRVGLLPLRGGISLHDDDARALGYKNLETPDWAFDWRARSSWRGAPLSPAGGCAHLLGAQGDHTA